MFTTEQLAVINSTQARVKVEALAGTGKTYTVIEYLRKQKGKKLYLVFNKQMQIEAKKKLTWDNVDIYTTYGFVYQFTGRQFSNRLGDLTVSIVKNITGLDITEAKMVLDCFNEYLASDIDSIREFSPRLFPYTSKLLKEILRNNKLPVPHSLYLKMWCISNPVINYDIIVVDEFQDVPKCLIKVLKMQNCNKILVVGDSNQNIYSSLTHTTNGLADIDWHKYSLTTTFRFSSGLCSLVNNFMNDVNRTIDMKSYKEGSSISSYLDCTRTKHYRIFRKNKSIILDALANMDRKIFIDDNVKELCKMISAVSRYKEFNTKTHYIPKSIKSFSALERYAVAIDHTELITACSLAKTTNMYEQTDLLLTRCVTENNCDIRYITAHKSKGLTIDLPTVVYSEDFYLTKKDLTDTEPINLFYVALTRASKSVYVFPFNCENFTMEHLAKEE